LPLPKAVRLLGVSLSCLQSENDTDPQLDFSRSAEPHCIDDKLLYASGVRDFDRYRVDASVPLASDFFVPDDDVAPPGVTVAPLR
jgi:hypothetical protein